MSDPSHENGVGVWPPRPMESRVICLAPMVRANRLPFRELALKYGADVAYSEELIAQRVAAFRRVVNEKDGTVDFLNPDSTVGLRVDPTLERGRFIVQIGAATPDDAAKATEMVAGDCAGVDLNMGCPKPFSTHGGMGAKLLADPERAAAIVAAMRKAAPAHVAVSAKIRLRKDLEETVALCLKLAKAGACVIAVHAREADENPPKAPPRLEGQRALFARLRGGHPEVFGRGGTCAILANGDQYDWTSIESSCALCDGVLIGRPALLNASIFRGPGRRLSRHAVLADYMTIVHKGHDSQFKNVKYLVMEMLAKRRHGRAFQTEMKADRGSIPDTLNIALIGTCKTSEALADALGMAPPASSSSDPGDGRVYTDAYFDNDDDAGDDSSPRKQQKSGQEAAAVDSKRLKSSSPS